MIVAAVIAGISAYLLNKPQKWTLTAPQTLVGMSPDTRPTDQLGFNALIAKFKSDLTSLPHYGSMKSTVSGIYRLNPRHAVGLIGFNGTFNVRVALKTGAGLTVTTANPGPHGGTAECGTDGINTLCQWSTGTTVGIVIMIPTGLGARPGKAQGRSQPDARNPGQRRAPGPLTLTGPSADRVFPPPVNTKVPPSPRVSPGAARRRGPEVRPRTAGRPIRWS